MQSSCIAVYSEDRRFVQVSAVVLDDAGASLHQHLKNASVQLRYNDTTFLTKQLEPVDYNEGEQAFYCFFLNPPVERNMYVVFDVETFEGLTAKVRAQVWLSTKLSRKDVAANPMLGGKPVLNYTDSTEGLNGVRTPL